MTVVSSMEPSRYKSTFIVGGCYTRCFNVTVPSAKGRGVNNFEFSRTTSGIFKFRRNVSRVQVTGGVGNVEFLIMAYGFFNGDTEVRSLLEMQSGPRPPHCSSLRMQACHLGNRQRDPEGRYQCV